MAFRLVAYQSVASASFHGGKKAVRAFRDLLRKLED